jgi:type IV pilus assembly protein PilQ
VLLQESQTFHTIEADVKLEITPYVGADGMITLEIKPDFRTPVGQFSSDVPPTINKRELSTTLAVKEGETVVLGGLVQESDSEDRTQVPLLGSIPLLGSLFSSSTKEKRKSQLMIYVTPRISYGEPFQSAYANPMEE